MGRNPDIQQFDAFGDALASGIRNTASEGGVRSTKLAIALFWAVAFVLAVGRAYIPVQPAQPGLDAAAPAHGTATLRIDSARACAG